MTLNNIQRVVFTSLMILILLLVMVWVKVSWDSRYHFHRAQDLMAKGEYPEAIVEYGEAIRCYTPFSRTVKEASEALWGVSERAETEQAYPRAVMALRELRAAYYAVRSFYNPGQDWIDHADQKLNQLLPLVEGNP